MSDITTKPTPIQRNSLDVAIELTQLHVEQFGLEGKDDLANTYAKYYAIANTLKNKNLEALKKFLPEEIKSKLKK
ncbi:hypothetical protein [Bacillus subtilis]|uniref:hypothetical protein n=1 Tax=Bacillus TaxID=1386 RepID=UPI00189E63B0|nr:hypothetical protein [Bacillus subtilis]MED1820996.1 hypothetical protein [Bacillus subtilis]QPF46861.1 hypothetical protein GO004_20905 [Bacillus subtilis]